ncbi:MAG: hypothetical protein B6U72_02975 [Candidatus Altiarchaeales archaeon ex4484_2]|nr:MAG: hypothetical protein B6U72_02975 [Candidatus Altiarchaeales archaeon ex4484_2]
MLRAYELNRHQERQLRFIGPKEPKEGLEMVLYYVWEKLCSTLSCLGGLLGFLGRFFEWFFGWFAWFGLRCRVLVFWGCALFLRFRSLASCITLGETDSGGWFSDGKEGD